ncbi:MAG: nucleotidyl transferase AbiEii/AbiGii toxin family protein [Candidatus Cloacimonetes bacterium]|nr:nucleotidyl transferase AbiEii/AbiGii toxin family protein [Candidatus Cloacimonadota bacterium]
MTKQTKNIAASARARLLRIAKENSRNFNAVLLQYFQERMLYRLSISSYKLNFILKGALLFLIYDLPPTRLTKDIDFLGMNTDNTKENLTKTMKEILSIEVDDGVQFDIRKITAEDITEKAEYKGVRIHCEATLEQARSRFHFDIGFGDQIVPEPIMLEFPVLLADMPVPTLVAYTPETAIAEKFEAMVKLGYANSRMKDFYDIYHMAHNFSFNSKILSEAINTTFSNRNTELKEKSIIFSNDFKQNLEKNKQWKAFQLKNNIELDIEFRDCLDFIQLFIEPALSEEKIKSWDCYQLKWLE